MSFQGFDKLDLTNVEVGSTSMMEAGINLLTVSEFEVKPASSNPNNKVLHVTFSVEGGGEIKQFFNVHNANPEATRIGLEQLKRFLIAAKAEDPNRPATLVKGLKVKADLQKGKPNQEGRSYLEIKRFFDAEDSDAKASPPPATAENSGGDFPNDDIPF